MDKEYRVVLNVGGMRHVTYKHTLKKIPATRLSRLGHSSANYDGHCDEYFFDRHPTVFTNVLNYYRTGKLHYPLDICGPLFEEELNYWGLDANEVEPCCWMSYRKHRETQEVLARLDEDDDEQPISLREKYRRFGYEESFLSDNLTKWQRFKPKLWAFADQPKSSIFAKSYGLVSVAFLMFAVVAFCLKTHKYFQVQQILTVVVNATNLTTQQTFISQPHFLIQIVEITANCWFATEILLRLISCPSIHRYFMSPANFVDLIATITFFIDFSLKLSNPKSSELEFFSIIRMARLMKLTQHSSGLKVLVHTFRASARELTLLVFFLMLGIVTFASLVYYGELMGSNPNNDFTSIPDGLWWAVVTMTTVGYGDMTPRTYVGRLIGSFCALTGVLTIALPVPVIVSNFEMYYSHTQAKQKMPKKKRVDRKITNVCH